MRKGALLLLSGLMLFVSAKAQFIGAESLYEGPFHTNSSQTQYKTSGLVIEETNPFGSYFGYPSTNTDLPIYGHRALFFNLPFNLSANGLNTDANVDTNVQGIANVYDPTGTLLVSLPFSSITPFLFPGNSTHLGTTPQYTLNSVGRHNIEVIVQSDSMGIPVNRDRDSVHLELSDSVYALDFDEPANTFGTPDFNGQALSVANYYVIDHAIRLKAVEILLADYTEPGSILEISVLDTIGFSFANGFAGSNMYAFVRHTVSSIDTARGFVRIPMDINGVATHLHPDSSEGYYLMAKGIPTSQHPIGFVNDSSILQPSYASIFHIEDGNTQWYTGTTQQNLSNSFQNRLIISPPVIGLNEDVHGDILCFPNPAQSEIRLESDISMKGKILKVLDMQGRVVLNTKTDQPSPTLQVSHLETGLYTLQIHGEDNVRAVRFTVVH